MASAVIYIYCSISGDAGHWGSSVNQQRAFAQGIVRTLIPFHMHRHVPDDGKSSIDLLNLLIEVNAWAINNIFKLIKQITHVCVIKKSYPQIAQNCSGAEAQGQYRSPLHRKLKYSQLLGAWWLNNQCRTIHKLRCMHHVKENSKPNYCNMQYVKLGIGYKIWTSLHNVKKSWDGDPFRVQTGSACRH